MCDNVSVFYSMCLSPLGLYVSVLRHHQNSSYRTSRQTQEDFLSGQFTVLLAWDKLLWDFTQLNTYHVAKLSLLIITQMNPVSSPRL